VGVAGRYALARYASTSAELKSMVPYSVKADLPAFSLEPYGRGLLVKELRKVSDG
jgi:hypothetical protein